MSVCIFTGPTLAPAEGQAMLPGARFFPPAAQGDVYRASLSRPWAIGIIDGYFERMPAVWHKEILWAMTQGIHVFGSASMGALRACELEAFGMVGVGEIFEGFRSGALAADDEVTVVHGAAEDGYRALSDALVDIRATLAEAAARSVITAESAGVLVELARRTFYAQRSFARLLAEAAGAGVDVGEIAALRGWLPGGRVDRKRRDALAMLRAMGELRAQDPGPKQVSYHFSYTDVWDQVARRTGRTQLSPHPQAGDAARAAQDAPGGAGVTGVIPAALQMPILIDELRLEGPRAYGDAVLGALARTLVMEESKRQGLEVTSELVSQTVQQVRRERGLLTLAQAQAWMASQHLDLDRFTQLVRREARLRWVSILYGPEIEQLLPDHLRMGGRYGALLGRALDKQAVLAAHGMETPGREDLGIEREALWAWYCGERLGEAPEAATPDGYAQSVGLADADELFLVLAREYVYEQLTRRAPPG
jgi:hypothetical protein